MGVQSRRVGQKGQMKFSPVCIGALIAICMIDNTRSFSCRCPAVSELVKYEGLDEAAAREKLRSCHGQCSTEAENFYREKYRFEAEWKLKCKADDIIFCSKPEIEKPEYPEWSKECLEPVRFVKELQINCKQPSIPFGPEHPEWKNSRECPEYEAFWKELNNRIGKTDFADDDEYDKLKNFVSEAAKGRGSWEKEDGIQCKYEVIF